MSLKKIAIVGPESTGKSMLAASLASTFHTEWVEEYAREYLNLLGRSYLKEDLLEIAKGQLALEQEKEQTANAFLFCDTNLLVINIWSEFVFAHTDPQIQAMMNLNAYDLHLLTDIDLPWEEDPLREHPHRRAELFQIYHQSLIQAGVPFELISGEGEARLTSALEALQRHSLLIA